MPMKLLKTETENELIVERVHHARRYSLTLDKGVCVGCEICKIICPKEAIEVKTFPKVAGDKAKRPIIDIDEQKCHYCGMCDVICPYGAITVRTNGEPMIPVVKTESFPQLLREIEVDITKCDAGCVECEEACPLGLIKVTVRTPGGEEVQDLESIESRPDRDKLTVTVDIKKELCPCCRLCEMKCPDGAIRVRKIFHGVIKINREMCPEGCRDCLDVCPTTGALYLSEDGKVYVNELYCVYCGVCKLVCPVEGALELQRTSIRHTPIHSGAWNKALEKLTSTKEMTKELRAKGLIRARESVDKRLAWRAA
ncbi:MAG: 4Fe-4S dicluster domain-containing protein [Candidatus Bathyarchaeia archaeon]